MHKKTSILNSQHSQNNMKANKEKTIIIISSVLLIFIIFSSSFFTTLYNKSFYDKQFSTQGTYDEFGVQGTRNLIDNLINYLISENTEIGKVTNLNIFMPEEQAHLKEVSRIISWIKYLGIISILGFIFFLWLRKKELMTNLKQILNLGAISTIVLLIIIFLLSIKFTPFFEAIHRLIFPQGNYSFPAHYLLIRMFPESFFQNFMKRMMIQTGIISMVLLGVSYFIKEKIKQENSKNKKKKVTKGKNKKKK